MRPGQRLPAAVADQPRRAGDQDLRGGDPAVGGDLGRRDRGLRVLPAPHPHGPQPVRDRGEPPRSRLCADQHAPHLDRHVRVQRRHLRARRRADRGIRRHGRRQRRRCLPVPERRRGHRRRHGVRRPGRLHPDLDRRVVPDRARHGPRRARGEPGSSRSCTARSSSPQSPSTGGRGGCATASERSRRDSSPHCRTNRYVTPSREKNKCGNKRSGSAVLPAGESSWRAVAVAALARRRRQRRSPSASSPQGPAPSGPATNCGDTVSVGPTNKNGVYSKMPKSLQDIYGSYPGKLDREPVGDDEDQGEAAVEDRLHRDRHHEPVQQECPLRS